METKRKLYIAAAVLIVLVVALGLLTACTSESLVAYEAPAVGTAPASYTLTVQASKGEAATSRALNLDSSGALNASWTKDDEVKVYNASGTEVGILKAASSGAETMLKGEVSNVAVNDVLTLKFLSPDYAAQDGTLGYIAANCDYATASVTVLGISGTDVTTTGADFENQQSIVKFTLQDKNNSNATITATDMIVVADGNTYSIKTTSATREFFVALPSFSEKAISVITTNGTDNYIFDRESTTIESGKYYTLTMQMDKLVGNLVNLSTLEGNYTAKNGDILTGTIDNTIKISIAAGASITLYNVSINAGWTLSGNTSWAGITCLGNATITLVGTNVVKACFYSFPGIEAGPANTTLTIDGTGSLTATGGDYGAGIGSRYDGSCGNISISGGTISATGGDYAAGIGSGHNGSCGNISISGGTINAACSDSGAGIGSGKDGTCGNITISGTASGSAKGGDDSPYDIGPGAFGTCGTVSVQENTISGRFPYVDLSTLEGNYTAKDGDILTGTIDNTIKISIEEGASITLYNVSINAGGADSSNTSWAGITCLGNATITLVGTNELNGCFVFYPGIQAGDEGTTLTIKGTGSLSATGGGKAAGIGSGMHGSCGNISITGGTINATGGEQAAGIGSGWYGTCGNITISGTASGSAKGGDDSPYDIGPGEGGTCGTVSVQDNTISGSYLYKAKDGEILTGTIDNSKKITIAAGASITLNNVSINANENDSGSTSLAGITCEGDATITLVGTNVVNSCGSGYPGIQAGPKNTTLTINGTGSLTATGGGIAAGIGSGMGGECGNISISGGSISAKGGIFAAGIGSGKDGSCGSISISGTASGSATGGNYSPYDIGPGNGGTCGTVSVADNTISGSYLGQTITCTFTVNFQSDGALNNMVKTDKITITCNGKTYTALRADEVGSYIRTGDSVQVDLPAGNNMSLTFTAECTFVTNSNPVGTFSATVGNVTITSSSSTLNEVTLVKQ